MLESVNKKDLRVQKTHRSLMDAFYQLLCQKNFNQININQLSQAATISRATFYTHFEDKYDLLKFWLQFLEGKIIAHLTSTEDVVSYVNTLVNQHQKLIAHVLKDANGEVLNLLYHSILVVMQRTLKRRVDHTTMGSHTLLLHFCAGGLMSWMMWQVSHHFPKQMPVMPPYLSHMIDALTQWDADLGADRRKELMKIPPN